MLFVNFGKAEELYCMKLLRDIRKAGINAEIFPEAAKMKKQFKYADDKGIPFVATVGTDEMSKGQVSLKNMKTGDQKMISVDDMIEAIKS